MVMPYGNRAAVATLPALALTSKPATIKEVIADFAAQCPHESVLECVQLIKGRTLRVVYPSAEVMEDIVSGGLTFRGHPLQFKTPALYKWVTLMDLPYGISDGEIKTVLSKFGQIAHIRAETYMHLYTGTRLIKMVIKTAIPSRIGVAGHQCTIFYRGQVRSCFRCGLTGHEAKQCPNKPTAPSGDGGPRDEVPNPPSNNEPAPTHREEMSITPPTSPRTFATVVSGPNPPTVIAMSSPGSVSAVTLPLPSSPTRGPAQEPPGMDTEVQSHKRPYSPVSESEWTDTDGSDRTRPRLEDIPLTEPTILEPGLRDRSPLRPGATNNDSTSDSSGKSSTSNESVIDPPAAQQPIHVEPTLQLTSPLDRRPLSIRYREYCSTASEYTTEEAAGLVESMLEVERQLASSTTYANEDEIKLQQLYDHLQLDHSIAVTGYNALAEDDPRLVEFDQLFDDAVEALATFESTYPEIVRTAGDVFAHFEPENEPENRQENPSDSPAIPDGQPPRPRAENPSPVDIPSPLLFPTGESTDSATTTTKSGHLKTNRRSRHKSKSPTGLASCVRRRTTPTLPGVRKKTSHGQHQPPPDSPYTPLVTDSGYLVTDAPRVTSPTRPQRPDTGAAGAIPPSPSSVDHP